MQLEYNENRIIKESSDSVISDTGFEYLHISDNIHSSIGINKTLDQFTYADYEINQLIIESMHEIEFIGIRGYTRFDENGDPSGIVEILQQHGES